MSNSAASEGTRKLQNLQLKTKKEQEKEKGRLSRGKEKRSREPRKEAFCSWEEGLEEEVKVCFLSDSFLLHLTPATLFGQAIGLGAALGPLAGRDLDPFATSPQILAQGPAAQAEGQGPRYRRSPRPPPARQAPPPRSRFLFSEHTPYKERSEQPRQRPAPARGLG